jgi:SAM-dependent methyltransferase
MTQTEIELPGTAGMVAGLLGNEVQSLYGPFAARLYHLMTQFDTVAMEELEQATKDVPGPVLELGAGTGRLTFPFLERGCEVVASDLSPDMLAILDQRLAEPEAASFAANCTTVVADMADFDLGRTFGIIVIGGSAIWSIDKAQRQATFENVKKHLTPDGRLFITVVNFPVQESTDPFERVIMFPLFDNDGPPLLCTVMSYMDPVEAIRCVSILAQRVEKGQVTETVLGSQKTYPVQPDVLAAEIEQAGLRVVERHSIDAGTVAPDGANGSTPIRVELRPTLFEVGL